MEHEESARLRGVTTTSINKEEPRNGALNNNGGQNSAEEDREGAEHTLEKIVDQEPQEDGANMYRARW